MNESNNILISQIAAYTSHQSANWHKILINLISI